MSNQKPNADVAVVFRYAARPESAFYLLTFVVNRLGKGLASHCLFLIF